VIRYADFLLGTRLKAAARAMLKGWAEQLNRELDAARAK